MGMMLLFQVAITHGQHFRYKRTLEADSIGWNKIYIPPQLEVKCKPGFADLRILALQKNGDTVEAPYVIKYPGNQVVVNNVALKILNRSAANGSYYYTFEKTGKYTIEQIELSFENKNFDYRVILEGSHNQQEWFTLLKNYRILSIKNNATNYAFTNLVFPETSYPFYRLQIPANVDPALISAAIYQYGNPKGKMETLKILSQQTEVNKPLKQTIFTVKLHETLPVSFIQVHTTKQGDFFRSTSMYQLSKDHNPSAEAKSNFIPWGNFTLSSLGSNSFYLPKINTDELKLVVENLDNEPLRIDSVTLQTTLPELWVRLPKSESYVITYGDEQAQMPQYDAEQVLAQTNPVPFISATLGEEQSISGEKAVADNKRWFEKDIYLYGIMIAIIGLLGYFSITMMRKKQ